MRHHPAVPTPSLRTAFIAVLLVVITSLFTIISPPPAYAQLSDPTIDKTFTPSTISVGGVSTLTFTLTNPNAATPLTQVNFADGRLGPLIGDIVIAATPNLGGTCGLVAGDFVPPIAPGGTAVNLPAGAGLTIAPSSSCTITVDVTAPAAGVFLNTTGPVGSFETGAGSDTGADTLTAVVLDPTIDKAFAPAAINLGGTSTLTFTLTNPNAVTDLTGLNFTDALPAGVEIAATPNLGGTCGAVATNFTPNIAAGGTAINLTSGVSLTAGSSCTITVDVTATTLGAKVNTTGAIGSTETGAGSDTATDTLTVALLDPTIDKAFAPATISIGGTSTLTFTLTNPNGGTGLTGLNFTDALPAGVEIAATPNLGGTCGAVATNFTPNVAPGGTAINLTSGVTLAAGSSCTITVDVTATTPGAKVNTTGAIGSTETGAGSDNATDTLTVSDPTLTIVTVGAVGTDNVDSTTGTPTPGPIDCPNGGVCVASFLFNDSVTLNVTVDPSSSFQGWSGDCAAFGAALSGAITMDGDKTCTATFTAPSGGKKGGKEEEEEPPPTVTPDVIKTVDREVAAVGDTLTYRIRFANPKDKKLREVVLTDTFDSRLDGVTVVSTSKGSASLSGNTVTIDGGLELAPGETLTLVVRATISARAQPGDVIDNTATLSSPDLSTHASNTVYTAIVGELPSTGDRPVRPVPGLLAPSLVVGGLLALLGLGVRRRPAA